MPLVVPTILSIEADDKAGTLDTRFPPMFRMETITAPFVSSLALHPERQPDAKVRAVARTSDHAVASSIVDLKPLQAWRPHGQWGQQVVGAVVEGSMKSAFSATRARPGARVFVFSSSQVTANPFARAGNPGNERLLQLAGTYADLANGAVPLLYSIIMLKNTFDWISNDVELNALAMREGISCGATSTSSPLASGAPARPIPIDASFNTFIETPNALLPPPKTDANAHAETQTTVTLRDAGAGTRSPLVYKFATTPRTLTTHLEIKGSGTENVALTIVATPHPAGADASIEYRITKAAVTVPADAPAEVSRAKAEVEAALNGKVARTTVSDHGITGALEMDGPIDQTAFGLVTRAVDLAFVPLANEPVGIGARWEVNATTRIGTESATTTTTITLTARDAATATLSITQTVSAAASVKGTQNVLSAATAATHRVIVRLDGPAKSIDGLIQTTISQPGSDSTTTTATKHVTSQ